MVASPYDVEVRYSHKRGTEWRGYKVHLTETCDADQPHLITHVETTAATEQDGDAVVPIHEALARKAVVPKEHLVDRGYPSADLLVESRQDYGIDLVGPMREDQSWQARTEGAFEQSQFQVDWQRKVVTCPQGKQSRYWKPWKLRRVKKENQERKTKNPMGKKTRKRLWTLSLVRVVFLRTATF